MSVLSKLTALRQMDIFFLCFCIGVCFPGQSLPPPHAISLITLGGIRPDALIFIKKSTPIEFNEGLGSSAIKLLSSAMPQH